MAKKPKEPRSNIKHDGDSESASGSSNIFKSLFGDIPEQGTSISIFSDNNPFRRKPNDRLGLGFGSLEDVGSSQNGDSRNPSSGEVKKRKRNKEEIPNVEDLEISLGKKKPKKGETGKPNFGTESNLGSVSKELSNKRKEKKGALGFESKEIYGEDDSRSPNLGVQSKELSGEDERMELNGMAVSEIERRGKEKERKSRKKRKRDELEAEYEERRYGVVVVKDDSREGGLGGVTVGKKRKTLDSPEDMFVSKEGYDDEDKLLRTVFVGNLPVKVKKKALLREFSQFGEVESVRIRSVPILNSKTPRKGAIIKKQINDSVDSVHAYIVFKMEESAQASLSHNMAVVGGNHIRVDRACPPRKKLKGENALLYDNKRTIFVGNLPFDVKDEEIYQLFCGINNLKSSIEAVRVIRDPGTSVGKGIAYVLFKTRDAANLVVKELDLKIRGRELRLSQARTNSTLSKRKYSSQNNFPAKKLALDSRTPDNRNKGKEKATISYQGLRASKSGVQKKVYKKTPEPLKLKSMTQKVEPKYRKVKRPAVAARKENVLKGGGVKQAGKKRKLESRTPENARRNKKARTFR